MDKRGVLAMAVAFAAVVLALAWAEQPLRKQSTVMNFYFQVPPNTATNHHPPPYHHHPPPLPFIPTLSYKRECFQQSKRQEDVKVKTTVI